MRSTRFAAALAAAVFALPAAATQAPREVLPFIADDYPKALEKARTSGKPIFLEAWAPW